MKQIKSEYEMNLTTASFADLQEKIQKMNPDELRQFQEQMDMDGMGFDGEEGMDNEN